MVSLFAFGDIFAQNCTVPNNACLDTGNPNDYKCGTAGAIGSTTIIQSLVISSQLLPANQEITTPQRIIFNGNLQVEQNYTFAPNSEIVFLSGGIQIIGGNTLTLKGVHVHGCAQLWDGIEVFTNSTLVSETSKLEDAKNAIRLFDKSSISAIATQFNGNFIGIFAGDDNLQQMPIKILGSKIEGCTFSGGKQLLSSFQSNSFPLNGIKVSNISQMNIIGTITKPNTFDGFETFNGSTLASSGIQIFGSVKI